jgi:hypothetical protein
VRYGAVQGLAELAEAGVAQRRFGCGERVIDDAAHEQDHACHHGDDRRQLLSLHGSPVWGIPPGGVTRLAGTRHAGVWG